MARTHSFAVTGPLTDFYAPPACFARFAPWQGIFLAGAYTGDLDTAFNASLWQLGWIAAVILTATLLLAWLINRDITGALGGLKPAMERLAQGDLSVGIPSTDRADELGGMARTVQLFKDNAARAATQQQDHVAAQQRGADEKRHALLGVADQFDKHVRGVVERVATTGTEMGSAARRVTKTCPLSRICAASIVHAKRHAGRGLGGRVKW